MDHLVGASEAAKILGVTRQRLGQMLEAYPDFPRPEAELSGGRIWLREPLEEWAARHPLEGRRMRIVCSFCLKPDSAFEKAIPGPGRVWICNRCVGIAVSALEADGIPVPRKKLKRKREAG